MFPSAKAQKAGLPGAGGPGNPVVEQVVVAPGDRTALAPRASGRSDDVGEPRNDLQDVVCPRPRRVAARADSVLAEQTCSTPTQESNRDPGAHPGDGDDQRATR